MKSLVDYIVESTQVNSIRPDRVVRDILSGVGAAQVAGKFGLGKLGTLVSSQAEPRKTYNFKVSMHTPQLTKAIEANIKSITRPKISLRYKTVRYFNTIRKTLSGIEFEPITMTIYDDLAGTVQREIQELITRKGTTSINGGLILGHSIDMKDFDRSIIDEVIIHAGSSPITDLIGGGFNAVDNLLKGAGSGSFKGVLSDSGVKHMKLLNCTIDSIDFGDFDYSKSEANEITIQLSYQALQFGASNPENQALDLLSGVGLKGLLGGI